MKQQCEHRGSRKYEHVKERGVKIVIATCENCGEEVGKKLDDGEAFCEYR